MFWKAFFILTLIFEAKQVFESIQIILEKQYYIIQPDCWWIPLLWALIAYLLVMLPIALFQFAWNREIVNKKLIKVSFWLTVPIILIMLALSILNVIMQFMYMNILFISIASIIYFILLGVAFHKSAYGKTQEDEENDKTKPSRFKKIVGVIVLIFIAAAFLIPIKPYQPELPPVDPEFTKAVDEITVGLDAKKDKETIMYKEYLKSNPHSIETYFTLDIYYRSKGQYDKAIKLYELGIEQNPDSKTLLSNPALVYMEKGDYKKASEILDKDPSLFMYNNTPYLLYLIYLRESGQYDKALKIIDAYKEDKTTICESYWDKKERKSCEVYLKIMTPFTPGIINAESQRAAFKSRIYQEKGDYENALKYAKIAAKKDKEDWYSRPFLDIYLATGNYDEALKCKENDYSLAYINFKKKDYATAEKHLKKLLVYKYRDSSYPRDTRALNLYGEMLMEQKKYPQAIAEFKKTLYSVPYSYKANYNIAMCYKKLGKKSLAKKYLNDILIHNPDNAEEIRQLANSL